MLKRNWQDKRRDRLALDADFGSGRSYGLGSTAPPLVNSSQSGIRRQEPAATLGWCNLVLSSRGGSLRWEADCGDAITYDLRGCRWPLIFFVGQQKKDPRSLIANGDLSVNGKNSSVSPNCGLQSAYC